MAEKTPQGSPDDQVRPPFSERAALFRSFARHVNGGKVARYREYGVDVVLGQRQGVYFSDAYSDRRWINCHCNGGLYNWGHRNPRVVEAVREALLSLDVGNHHLVSGYRARLAERLAATTGGELPGVVFGVSGGEAIDLAIKVVRGCTGRQTVVSACGGYHGHTGLALATGDPSFREPFGPNPPGFRQVPFNDVDALAAAVDEQTAAVLLETVPATLGMVIPEPGYLAKVGELCRERGAKLILDEVQSGLGRTGKIWGYQHDGVEPDVVVVGKGLSGGIYPITATLMTAELHAFFDDKPFIHVSTFGGAEPGCVAAETVLDLIEEPGFLERVDAVSARLVTALEPCGFELRHRGLMMGMKFSDELKGLIATKMLYDQGVFVTYAGNDPSVVQLLPPLTISDDELQELIAILTRCFSAGS